jgi:hypothetical protein
LQRWNNIKIIRREISEETKTNANKQFTNTTIEKSNRIITISLSLISNNMTL